VRFERIPSSQGKAIGSSNLAAVSCSISQASLISIFNKSQGETLSGCMHLAGG
jgi:hypothetical protein